MSKMGTKVTEGKEEIIHGVIAFDLQGALTTVNRGSAEAVIKQLGQLRALGMLLYTATSGGGGKYQPGSIALESWIMERGTSIPKEDSGSEAHFLGAVCEHSGVQPGDVYFFGSGTANVSEAERVGVKKAIQVNVATDLIAGLNAILVEFGVEAVVVELADSAAVSARGAGGGAATAKIETADYREDLARVLASSTEASIEEELVQGLLKALEEQPDSHLQKLGRLCAVYIQLHDIGVKHAKGAASDQEAVSMAGAEKLRSSWLKTLKEVIERWETGGEKRENAIKLMESKLSAVHHNPEQMGSIFQSAVKADMSRVLKALQKEFPAADGAPKPN